MIGIMRLEIPENTLKGQVQTGFGPRAAPSGVQITSIVQHPLCTMRGNVIGPWVDADATIVDATTAAHGHALLRHKYGWMKRGGDGFSRLLRRERVVRAMRFPE